MTVVSFPFGSLGDGTLVTAYRLENAAGASVTLLDYGATVQSLCVPDRDGKNVDVVLGYDTAAEYARHGDYLGATIGRVGNRIGGAAFSLGGQRYELAKNDGPNHLHGGLRGFDKYIWTAEPGEDGLSFSRRSPDGEENYPGNLDLSVRFALDADNALHIVYDAVCDRDTLLNLTNHSYFNLSGGGSVLDHLLTVNAERFCEGDGGCLTTGRILSVAGTPFDFRTEKPIGRDIHADAEQLRLAGGYDHNFCLSGPWAARLRSDESGIEMDVYTFLPGMQLYTSNMLGKRSGKGGAEYGPFSAVCLETQLYPNGMAFWGFPSPVLPAGQRMHSETVYAFSAH